MEYSEKEYLIEGTAIDLFVAYRFLRILTTPWEDQDAFKLGIIDKDGKLLRKKNTLKTTEEKQSFTLLHRLVFNLKRILHKIPGVRTKIGTYATALFLLKQHFADKVDEEDMIENAFTAWLLKHGYDSEEELGEAYKVGDVSPTTLAFRQRMKDRKAKPGRPKEPEKLSVFLQRAKKGGYKVKKEEIDEEVMGLGAVLEKGSYKLNQDIFAGNEGDIKGKKGDVVIAFADTAPSDTVLGQEIFKVVHQKSKSEIYVSLEDLEEK